MKKLFILFVAALLAISTQAQDSIPQYFTGTESWGSTVRYFQTPDEENYEMLYFLNGDTIINNQTYWKLYLSANIINRRNGAILGNIKADSVWGYVRQENHTVFYMGYYPPSYRLQYLSGDRINEEDTLVSYDLNIGDTIPNTWVFSSLTNFTYDIDFVDSLLLDNNMWRKTFNNIIEGVSHIGGSMFDPLGNNVETITTFNCFESTQYNRAFACNNSEGRCFEKCDFRVNISENNRAQSFSIYPNPAKSTVYLRGFNQNYMYTLRDVAGKVLWKNSNYKGESISLENLQYGLYFIEEYSSSGALTQSKKLVVQ